MIITAFLLLPNVFFAQQTYVPDDNFEQALISLRYDEGELNDYVPTANIETVTVLEIDGRNISDLTGIEDFIALERLICHVNNLTSLEVSDNRNLQYLECWRNNLTNLDLSNNFALETLYCGDNDLTILDVGSNSAMRYLN